MTLLSPDRQLALVRFDADGTPDPTFGVNGVSVITSGVNDPQPHGIVVLPNGKFIVSGFVTGLPHFLGLVRLNADGSLDTAFGTGGVLDVPITGTYKVAKAKASASAKGVHLGLPTLPLPTIVQLRSSSGLCFETGFSSAGVQRNDASQFKGKAD